MSIEGEGESRFIGWHKVRLFKNLVPDSFSSAKYRGVMVVGSVISLHCWPYIRWQLYIFQNFYLIVSYEFVDPTKYWPLIFIDDEGSFSESSTYITVYKNHSIELWQSDWVLRSIKVLYIISLFLMTPTSTFSGGYSLRRPNLPFRYLNIHIWNHSDISNSRGVLDFLYVIQNQLLLTSVNRNPFFLLTCILSSKEVKYNLVHSLNSKVE